MLKGRRSLYLLKSLAIATAVILLIELLEHAMQAVSFITRELSTEVLLYGLTLPVFLLALLGIHSLQSKKARMDRYLTLQQFLRGQLSKARDWEERAAILLQFPRTILPAAGVALFVPWPANQYLELVAEWSQDGRTLPRPPFSLLSDLRPANLNGCLQPLPPWDSEAGALADTLACYCLPLVYSHKHVASLLLYFPAGATPPREQAARLAEIAPELALATENALLHRSIVLQELQGELQQQHLARDLHDSLGQNVAYMRMKLEQLTGDKDVQSNASLALEIERMLEIAQDSYDQVRTSLSSLRGEKLPELPEAIFEHAKQVSEAANFKLRFISHGKPHPLNQRTAKQVLYVVREALRNIEKHAKAKQVTVEMDWLDDHLKIDIQDDGIGFDLEAKKELKGHYGLRIMQESMEEIGGELEIETLSYVGTRLALCLSYEPIRVDFPAPAKIRRLY